MVRTWRFCYFLVLVFLDRCLCIFWLAWNLFLSVCWSTSFLIPISLDLRCTEDLSRFYFANYIFDQNIVYFAAFSVIFHVQLMYGLTPGSDKVCFQQIKVSFPFAIQFWILSKLIQTLVASLHTIIMMLWPKEVQE